MSTTFRYYRDSTIAVFIRRFLLAVFLSSLFIYSVSLILFVLELVEPRFEEWLKSHSESISFLPPTFKNFLLDTKGHFGLILIISLALLKANYLRKIDFFLFSSCNRDLFKPIQKQTGIFSWASPITESQENAWNTLYEWATSKIGDGRWNLSWCWSQPDLANKPDVEVFSWNLIVGASGAGKTQLAKELGKTLEARDKNQKWSSVLTNWWNKVVPWIMRKTEEPWDCGILTESGDLAPHTKLEALKKWRPSAPSFIIVDDPPQNFSQQVIDIFQENSAFYWYPVRLLFTNQYIAPDLPVVSDKGGSEWHFVNTPANYKSFQPVTLKSSALSRDQFRQLLVNGVWIESQEEPVTAKDLPALFKNENKDDAIQTVEGNVLLLALVALWVASHPKKQLHNLLSTASLTDEEQKLFEQNGLTYLVKHRLIKDRLERLYQLYQDLENSNTYRFGELCSAIACSTLATGISVKQAKSWFNVTVPQSELRTIFYENINGVVETVTPITPWLIGQSFVSKQKRQLSNKEDWQQLVGYAMQSNPGATLKNLVRFEDSTELDFSELLSNLTAPNSPEEQLSQLMSLIEFLFYGLRKESEENSKIVLNTALEMIDKLNEKNVLSALRQVENLWKSKYPDVPNAISRLIVYFKLSNTSLKLNAISPVQLIKTFYNLGYLFQTLASPLLDETTCKNHLEVEYRTFVSLAFAYSEMQSIEVQAKICREMNQLFDIDIKYFRDLYHQNLINLERSYAATSVQTGFILIGRLVYEQWESRFDFLKEICDKITNWCSQCENKIIALEIKLSTQLSLSFFNMHELDILSLENTVEQIVKEVNSLEVYDSTFKKCSIFQSIKVGVLENLLFAYAQCPEYYSQVEKVLNTMSSVVENCPQSTVYLRYIRAMIKLVERFEQTDVNCCNVSKLAELIENCALKFKYNAEIQDLRAEALCFFAKQYLNKQDSQIAISRIATKMEKLANIYPDYPNIKYSQINVWRRVVQTSSEKESFEYIQEFGNQANKIATQFPLDISIQRATIELWTSILTFTVSHQKNNALALKIAKHIDSLAQSFPEDVEINLSRAVAWKDISYSYSGDELNRHKTPEVMSYVEEICKPYPEHLGFQECRLISLKESIYSYYASASNLDLAKELAFKIESITNEFPEIHYFQQIKNDALMYLESDNWFYKF